MRLHAIERRWIALVSETIFPANVVPGLPGAGEVAWDPFLDDLAARAPFRMLAGLKLALVFVALLAPFLVLGRLRTFAGLAAEERLRVLARLRESRVYVIRELPVLLKSVAAFAYCGLPAVRERLGLPVDTTPPPWVRT
jgi:hypothetical protein